jgi:gamma-glutamyl hercynylcysteine S-oxide synthase
MTIARTLGPLSNLHQMLVQVVESLTDSDLRRCPHPSLFPPGWYLGRAVYLETYWLRERLAGDDDLTRRVRHIFAKGACTPAAAGALLPPRDHLLNWALEIQDDHLTRLANPGLLPRAGLDPAWLAAWLLQAESLIYEDLLLAVGTLRLEASPGGLAVTQPLRPALPRDDSIAVSQGHYRIGAREGVAFDNELPVQVVELHNFRIAARPVSNAEFLAFMRDEGYAQDALWSDEGRAWRDAAGAARPFAWRADAAGDWYAVGLNGPYELLPDEPVAGVSHFEAQAYAAWAAAHGGATAGAVLPHEYQWETAVRTQAIADHGRVLEWCANRLEPYDRYLRPDDAELATAELDGCHFSLRGATLHTQACLRRPSLRRWGLPGDNHRLAGFRLVFPPRGD